MRTRSILIPAVAAAVATFGLGAFVLLHEPASAPPVVKQCTMEAKICPDGTAVGRTGPDCAFAPCPVTTNSNVPPMVGGDRDSHGCIGSAGYTWCEAKQKCLRSWEEPCSDTQTATPPASGAPAVTQMNTVTFSCDGRKKIGATFIEGAAAPASAPGQPPTPSGSVQLDLGGGTILILPQTISADGARYANADESFVFWNKGDGAMVLQNGVEKEYTNCKVAGQ